MEDLAAFVGIMLLVMAFAAVIAAPISFVKTSWARVSSLLTGLPGALLGMILLFSDISNLNTNMAIISIIPIVGYSIIIINFIRWFRR